MARAASTASRHSGQRVDYVSQHRYNDALCAGLYRLANGLGILLLPDQRAPIFAYQTWFAVGSKHEHPERTGLAHLFEHLMFKGTRNHPTGEFDREMERRGTQTNAATWVDWTYYTETLAGRGDNLARVIDYESDRMTELLLDETTFRSELEVVKNERRMSVEDSVSGLLSEKLYATAFTVHPYRWPTIGAMQHLEAARVDDLVRFYRTYYAPNNATVVVAGAIDLEDTLVALARAYGSLAAQAVPRPALPVEPEQQAPRQGVIERPVVAPQLLVAYRAPAQTADDYPVMEMLNEVLTTGDNARLYRRLVSEEALASDINGSLAPFAEPGLYEVMLTLRAGADAEEALKIVQAELDSLARGISDSEVRKAQHGLELSWLDSLTTSEGCAESLGHFQTTCGDYTRAFAGAERWQRLGAADLIRVAAARLKPERRTTMLARAPG